MAIYNKARLIAGSTTLDTYIRSMAFNHSAEELDDTAMGDDTRTSAGGLERWTIECEFNQAFGASTPDATFATAVGTVLSLVWRHTTTATAVTTANPKYAGSGLITEYVPQAGSVGDQKTSTVSIVSAGDATRTTT